MAYPVAEPRSPMPGIGRRLLEYGAEHYGIREVTVNEQNPQAAGFYERMGFRTAGRDATDPSGRPYPILHMELGHAPHTGLVPIPSLLIDRIDIDFRAEVPGTDTEKQP
jgi:putative acetyltransferase